jgi:hypothetical protein
MWVLAHLSHCHSVGPVTWHDDYRPHSACVCSHMQEYSLDNCKNETYGFTNGQIARMQLAWQALRQCSNYTVGRVSGEGVINCDANRWIAEAEAKCAQVAQEASARQNLANTVTPCPCGVLDAGTVGDSTNVSYTSYFFIPKSFNIQNSKFKFIRDFSLRRSCKFSFDLTCCFSLTFGGLGLVGESGPCLSNCPAGSPCNSNRVCASGVCSDGTCQAPSCGDDVLNGGALRV